MVGRAGSVTAQAVETTTEHPNRVHRIDLAAWIREKLPVAGGLSLLKLDVEGSEYSLLPWLLMQGAYCRVSHVIQEWHLHAAPPATRLEALALRLSFHALLRNGCPDGAAPIGIWHDEWPDNNFGWPVPGLPDVAVDHAPWDAASLAGSGWNAANRAWREKARWAQRDDAALEAQSSTLAASADACARAGCHSVNGYLVPFVVDSCRYDRISCEPREARRSYAHAVNGTLNAASVRLVSGRGAGESELPWERFIRPQQQHTKGPKPSRSTSTTAPTREQLHARQAVNLLREPAA